MGRFRGPAALEHPLLGRVRSRSTTGRSADGTAISDLYYSEELATRYSTPWMLDAGLQAKRAGPCLPCASAIPQPWKPTTAWP